jgi:hypothetical protein
MLFEKETMMKAILFALALIATATPAFAQDCPVAPSLAAGSSAADAPLLKPGQAVTFAMKPAPQVHFNAAARRSDDAKTWGGIAVFNVGTASTWRVSLGAGAWIAVVQDGVEVQSATHSHGEACLTKMVDFPLRPGKVFIELSAATQSSIRLMATPAG